MLVLEVSDDGCGMDARTRAHLFEPYFTTKTHGHGLGLATVYGIVTRAGGSIEVASAAGEGTCFRVVLPRQLDA
jgi:two-component system cell cycle sensor histidine kinase/response regulator CckA